MQVKRILDICFALILIGAFLLPIIAIAILTYASSKGPILHWSVRKGINDNNFKMPKFRSMFLGAPISSTDGIDSNHFVTPLGKFIRKYSLDELPQLFSILIGDMSFVGPRPALYSQYNLILFRKKLGINKIKPGLTGLAQVSGRSSLTVEDKVYFDHKYLQKYSIWFDFKILLRTIYVSIMPGEDKSGSTTWPSYTIEEANAAKKVVLSCKLNDVIGNKNKNFEDEFCKTFGVKYASTISSGTSALEVGLRSLGIGIGDEVIVPSRSFVSSATCVANIGANPVFVDVDYNNGNISIDSISRHISSRTKAILCVHLGGHPCDMDGIMRLSRRHKLFVVEDCAQAPGAKYKGRSVGSIGNIGAWSFCNDKIISTGEGGMVTTNSKALLDKINAYKNHGRPKKLPRTGTNFSWECSTFGTNMRMTEIQAIIGSIQLRKLDIRHQIREKYAKIILKEFKKYPLIFRVPKLNQGDVNAWYRIYVFLRTEHLNSIWTRDKVIKELRTQSINVNMGSCPEIYLEKCFRDSKFFPKKQFPNAKSLGESSLSIIINSNIPIERIQEFVFMVNAFVKNSKKMSDKTLAIN